MFVTLGQVKVMNAAIEKDSQEETMEEKDADSRRFLKETVQNYTEAPWEVGKAGQQVIPFLILCWRNVRDHHIIYAINMLTSSACMLQYPCNNKIFI